MSWTPASSTWKRRADRNPDRGKLNRKNPGDAYPSIAICDSYNGCVQVSVADAKNKLPELIKAVEDGEPVTT